MFECDYGYNCLKKSVCSFTQDNDCERQRILNSLFDDANIPKHQRTYVSLSTKNSHDDEVFRNLASFQKSIESHVKNGDNLYIYSKWTGNGKTSWAVRMIQSYLNAVWFYGKSNKCRAVFVNVPRICIQMKDDINNHTNDFSVLKKKIREADLVVWDDIGSKEVSAYEASQILPLIDERLFNGLSNIYTSNILPTELEKTMDARIVSRIRNSVGYEIIGHDRRGNV